MDSKRRIKTKKQTGKKKQINCEGATFYGY